MQNDCQRPGPGISGYLRGSTATRLLSIGITLKASVIGGHAVQMRIVGGASAELPRRLTTLALTRLLAASSLHKAESALFALTVFHIGLLDGLSGLPLNVIQSRRLYFPERLVVC